ncbi:unnamed protein product [Prorocentrum cordatum]|uniref:Phospholipase D n=1 Tax=Prorocentrum cordatum TaxID=2364126 RepID=A0ABN9W3D5_9DINO|nr:unnamed protein product [Polarella glacialis]
MEAGCVFRRTRPLTAISHNKFFVLVRGDQPIAVWTGSTNITTGAIFGHSNVGHVVRDAGVCRQYLEYWERLKDDPDKKDMAAFNDRRSPLPAAKEWAACSEETSALAFFSPRLQWASALEFLAQLVAGAKQGVAFTAAFGISKEMSEGNGWMQENLSGLNNHVKFIHTKILLVDPLSDNPIVVSGSANFSRASMESNDENMLVVRGDRELADSYTVEFFRVFEHLRFRSELKSHQKATEGQEPEAPRLPWPRCSFGEGSAFARLERRALGGLEPGCGQLAGALEALTLSPGAEDPECDQLSGALAAAPGGASPAPPLPAAAAGCQALAAPPARRLEGKSPLHRPKDLAAVFSDADADGDGSLGLADLRGYLGDFLGYGDAEIVAFHQAAGGESGVTLEAFRTGIRGSLSPYSMSKRKDCVLVRKPGAFGGMSGVDFQVEECSGCTILICDRTDQVYLDELVDCIVLVGPCNSSIFARNCRGCTFWLACRQLRTRDCASCTFHLHSHTEPVIESSSDLSFAPFAAEYPGLSAQFKQVGFVASRNLWTAIFDFTGRADGANWRILPLDECEKLVVAFERCSDQPDSPAPELTHQLLIAPPPAASEGQGVSVAKIPQTENAAARTTDAHAPRAPEAARVRQGGRRTPGERGAGR